jgi:hypothetical protein
MARVSVDGGTVYNDCASGEYAPGDTSAHALPSVVAQSVVLVAPATNSGDFVFGGSGVTFLNGTTTTTAGIPIPPGGSSDPIRVNNLSVLSVRMNAAGDSVLYFILR